MAEDDLVERLRAAIGEVVRAAVAAERERCARIVCEEVMADGDAAPCCQGNAADILARIRQGEP